MLREHKRSQREIGAIFEAARTWTAISMAFAFVNGFELVPLISALPAKWLDSMAGAVSTVPFSSTACRRPRSMISFSSLESMVTAATSWCGSLKPRHERSFCDRCSTYREGATGKFGPEQSHGFAGGARD